MCTDDVPVAQVHTDSAIEDGAVVAGNVPAATDLDGDVDANGYALITNVGEGSLVFNADGSYTFDVGANFQDLDATESRDVTFTYTATDDQGNVSAPATVTLTVTGTDDVPVAQVHADSAVEDGAIVAGNVPAATDLDGDVDANGYALVTSVGEGTLTFNADGSYTFDVGAAFQDLDATELRDVTFTYTATDDQVTLLALATGSVQLVPPTLLVAVMGLQVNQLVFGIIVATVISTTSGLIAAKLLAKTKRYRATNPMNFAVQAADSDHQGGTE